MANSTLDAFLSKNTCKKLFISNNVSEINDVLKCHVLASKNPIIDIETTTVDDLAKVLFLSFNNDKTVLSNQEALVVFYTFLSNKKDPVIYKRIPIESVSVSTSNMVYQTINQIRLGKRKTESNPLDSLITDFENYLLNQGFYDLPLLLKTINIDFDKQDRKQIKNILGFGDNLAIGLLISFIEKMNYQQSLFIENISSLYKREPSVIDFRNPTQDDVKVYKSVAYGYVNEVRHIIDYINSHDTKLSEISIYITDNKYENIIKAYFENAKISYVFTSGENGGTNESLNLVKYIISFLGNHLDINDLYQIYRSKILKNEYKFIGTLKDLRSDKGFIKKQMNDCRNPWSDEQKEFVNSLLNIYDIDLPVSKIYHMILDIYDKYVLDEVKAIDKGMFIEKENLIKHMDSHIDGFKEKLKFILESLSNIKVKRSPVENTGYIEINNLSTASFLNRRINFVIGLSANQFNVKEVESPLFSDNELQEALDTNYFVDLASGRNNRFIDGVNKLFSTLNEGEIHLIRSSYDSSELKDIAPAIIMNKDGIEEEVINHYRDDIVNVKNDMLLDDLLIDKSIAAVLKATSNYSPSVMEEIITCPLQYLYSNKYGEISLDEYEGIWLKGGDSGNFAHKTLEYYFEINGSESTYNETKLDECFNKAKEEWKELIPFDNASRVEYESKSVKAMVNRYLKRYYEDRKANPLPYVVLATEIHFDHVVFANMTFNGTIDRIDGYVDDNGLLHLRIIDYKTTATASIDSKKKNGSLTQSAIYPVAAIQLIKAGHKKIHFERLATKFTDISDEVCFIYELIKTDKKIEYTKEKIEEQASVIIDAKDKLDTLLSSPTYNNLLMVYEPQIGKESENNQGRCKYCKYANMCHLKLKKGVRTIWENQK